MPAPFLAAIAPSLVAAASQTVAQASAPARQYKWNKRAAIDAQNMNRENVLWMIQQNKQLQEEQRMYDSPAAQKERYLSAGLNPHLIYGSGTSAGQAFPISAGNISGSQIDAPSAPVPDFAGNFIRASQNLASIENVQAKTALSQIQTDIAKTNPMLNPGVAEWVSSSLQETSRLKAIESRVWLAYDSPGYQKIAAKVNAELETMSQRLGLNTTDLQIKNRILESKEFENAIKEIQVKWLKDSEITPEHIRQGLMLLLTKMLGR